MKNLLLILISFITFSCSNQDIKQLYFLEGNWQVEDKQQFEKWEKKGNDLIGVGYKLIDGEEQVLENLAIRVIDGQVVYQATVANQNDGSTISFQLNDSISDFFSFENPEHDFPKKIQYFKLDGSKLKVNVIGEDEKGFTFIMNRVRQ